MEQVNVTYLGNHGYAIVTSTAIVVLDYTIDPTQSLPRILMGHSVLPITFIVSGPLKQVLPTVIFSMAENRVRTYILSATIARSAVDSEFPVSWIDPDNVMPGVPGDISVASVSNGTANVSYNITSDKGTSIDFSGDTGKLSINSRPVSLTKPGQSINI